MEREVLEFDVQWIGAGPAGLAGAIHLSDLIEKHNQSIAAGAPGTSLPEVTIAVLEKAARVGAHGLSGLVMDPRAMLELMPDFRERGCPIEAEVTSDDVYLMWEGGQLRLPIAPPPLQNHGNLIASLGSLTEWMAGIAESKGVLIATETPAASPLVEAGRVVGVRSGDKGIDKHGAKKATYQPGADCRAKVTVLCEGPRGTIAKALEPQLGLTVGRNPQVYSTGVKELWEMPPGRVQKGRVTHTMGFPLSNDTFGGGFIYGAGDSHWAIGFVTGLDAHDPTNDPHGNLQRFKTHPLVRGLIEGGKLVSYGAKAIPEGGYWAMPKLSADGLLLCGDSGGFLNGARLKGVHLAIKSGMLAAETAVRMPARRRLLQGAAGRLREALRELVGGRRAALGAQLPPGIRARTVRRDVPHRRPDAARRPRPVRRSAHRACRDTSACASSPRRIPAGSRRRPSTTARSPSTSSPTSTSRAPRTTRTSPRTWWSPTRACARRAAARSTAIPASTSALRTCTRWCPTRRSRGRSSSTSTPRTACTARPATSPIPTRSLPGPRPKAAAVRTTKGL